MRAQPRELLDRFRRKHTYLRVSLTERCNLRCFYCMPAEGVCLSPATSLLTYAETVRLIGVFATLGISKVRLTGGEPLLYGNITQLCRDIRAIPTIQRLGITTNGVLLPRMIPELHAAGVTDFNISLDTLDEAKYIQATRRRGLHRVLAAIQKAEDLGYDPVKVNCVLLRGVNEDDIVSLAAMTSTRNIEMRFIEFMPFDSNQWSRDKLFTFMEAMDRIEAGMRTRLVAAECSETARLFRVPGHRGKIGFISSATSHFCGTCNRVRLTADGSLKVCLFDDREVSLRDALRSGATDAELQDIIDTTLQSKHFSHGGKETVDAIAASPNRPMVRIGG